MNKPQTVIRNLRIALGMKVALEQMKLADGETTIEADSFEANKEVFVVTDDDQRIAVPVGEYELEDGKVLVVVEEGIISEVKEMEAPAEPATEEAPVEATKSEPTAPKKTIESTVKETHFSKEEMDAKDTEIIELKAQLKLANEVVKPIVHNPENVKKTSGKISITEHINNL